MFQWIGYLTIILFLTTMILFITLTVEVKEGIVKLSFGIGLIKKNFSLDQVKGIEIVKNPFWYGWGIRIIPGGRLYNVSGNKAVELKMKNNKIIRIGTNQPEELYNALKVSSRLKKN
jgi:hypothetical protein